ncbi:MAG: Ig-like domain-containing protein [Gemmatimonadetes bacterium]|nr:Ig-like domain-containing protein [Gemmatimonadota bacterium]
MVVAPATVALVGSGQTATVTAAVTASNGPVASPTVSWSSSNVAVATVTGSGGSATITSVAPGTTTVTATSGGVSGSTTVTVQSPGSVTLSVAPLTVAQGASDSTDVTITRTNYSGAVTLALQNPPTGISGTFGAARPGPNGTEVRTLTLTVVAAIAPGTYSLVVAASGPGLTPGTGTVVLSVITPVVGSFIATLSASSGTVFRSGTRGAAISVARAGGFTGNVSISLATPLPTGVTVDVGSPSLSESRNQQHDEVSGVGVGGIGDSCDYHPHGHTRAGRAAVDVSAHRGARSAVAGRDHQCGRRLRMRGAAYGGDRVLGSG